MPTPTTNPRQKNLDLPGLQEYDRPAREIAQEWLQRIKAILDADNKGPKEGRK